MLNHRFSWVRTPKLWLCLKIGYAFFSIPTSITKGIAYLHPFMDNANFHRFWLLISLYPKYISNISHLIISHDSSWLNPDGPRIGFPSKHGWDSHGSHGLALGRCGQGLEGFHHLPVNKNTNVGGFYGDVFLHHVYIYMIICMKLLYHMNMIV